MFALFYSLYLSMFTGTWTSCTTFEIASVLKPVANALSSFLTSLFNNVDTPMTTLGDTLFSVGNYNYYNWIGLVAFVLALITSIGIVVLAVKGVKKAFSIFFMGLR